MRVAFFLGTGLALTGSATAQDNDDDLAKKSQNPLANMIALPLHNNSNFGAGPVGRPRRTISTSSPFTPSG